MEEDATLTREEILEEQAERGPIEFMGYDEDMLRAIVEDFERRVSQPAEAPLPPPPGPPGPPLYVDVDGAIKGIEELRAMNERMARINRTQEEWERIYQAEESLAEVNRTIGLLQSINAKDPKGAIRAIQQALYVLFTRQQRDLMAERDKARGE